MLSGRFARRLLAPSTALIGRMRYAHKFAVVGLVLIVPLATVAGAYVHVQREQIAFSTRERHGVACLGSLRPLVGAVIAARQAAASGADPATDPATDRVRRDGVAAAVSAVDAVFAVHGPTLGLESRWAAVRAVTDAARSSEASAGTPSRRVAAYDEVVGQVLKLVVAVGDASNLTLDPDLDTYYLMDTVQFRLPVVADAVARVSVLAAMGATDSVASGAVASGAVAPGAVASGAAGSDEQIRLGIARGVLSSSQDALLHDLDTVVSQTADGEVRRATTADAARLGAALDAFSAELDGAVRAGSARQVDPAVSTRLLTVVDDTTANAVRSLDSLLLRRIDRLGDGSRRVVVGTVGAALIAMYLFLGFYVSVVSSVSRIVASLRAVAAGDLTQRAEVDTQDEMRFVAEVLNETVSRTREVTHQLTEQATTDALTGLPNRVQFLRRLDDLRREGGGWVLFIDLDRFKLVNDSYGHEAGDEVLREVAHRLRSLLSGVGLAARLAGDEFGVLLPGGDGPGAVDHLGSAIVRRLSEPVRLGGGRPVDVAASVGAAPVAADADAEELLRRADVAMYGAKHAGRGQVVTYDAALAAASDERLRTRTQLREALEHDQLKVHYQPIVDVGAGVVVGFEALARWEHPERGLLLPGHFVDVAEESGLIIPLGTSVLSTACRQMAIWHAQHPGAGDVFVSVNVSPTQLASPDVVAVVAGVLAETGLASRSLCLEITETTLMLDSESSRSTLNRLRALGIRLAIDDFGVGYSSLSYLSRFPVQTLKLDRSFVSGMMHDEHDAAIVSMLVGLGAHLNLTMVAEGVETVGQRDRLAELGYSTMQGFLFGRPMPSSDVWRGLAAVVPAPRHRARLLG